MKAKLLYLLLTPVLILCSMPAFSQQDSAAYDKGTVLPDKLFNKLDQQTLKLTEKLHFQTEKYLSKLEKTEQKLQRKLWRTDSVKAKEVFGNVQTRYDAIRKHLHAPASAVYNGRLDSLGTALNFLQTNPQLKQASQLKEKPGNNLQSITALQHKLNQTEQIRKQINQRQQELKQHLQNTPLAKEFQKFKKEVYYYQAQVREYQEALKDPKKLGAKLLQVVNKVPAFQDFFRRNSELAGLFRLPGAGSDAGNSTASIAGLQTRADVQNMLQQRLGSGADAQQYLQQQMGAAQGQMQELKNKIQQYKQGSYGNGEAEMPDFKVNNQKTKSFLQRIEWGSNLQTVKGNLYFPVTSDIGVSAGYKLNDKSIIGIGASYKMGLGRGWQNINITHQGAGLRTFVDIKLKGSFWISGGGELNYRNEFRRIDVLKDMNAWQQSALLGISKKYKVGKKMKGNAQLLYDFLWKQQQPQTQAVLIRVGYNF